MLEVQKFLSTKSFDDLTAELGIKVNRHESLPLVILNYDQIESPKTHPVVRECRGLVLNSNTHKVVARSFNRFFNWGEVADEMNLFNFSDFSVQSKEDGSLVLLYYHDGWRANTRGSFAVDNMQFQNFSWKDGICKALNVSSLDDVGLNLNTDITFVCEFVSPWNKVVRQYNEPAMYLLTAFYTETGEELSHAQCDGFARAAGMRRPTLYKFTTIEEIMDFLQRQASTDPTFEGVVLRDSNSQRWKVKSATYLGLHRLKGEGDNMFNPKHLLPFVLAGEEAELLCYFPEVKKRFYEVKAKVADAYAQTLEAWMDNQHIPDRKDFALAVKAKPFSSVLFGIRGKHEAGEKVTSTDIRKVWRESEQLILKKLFKA